MTALFACALAIFLAWALWPQPKGSPAGGGRVEEGSEPAGDVASAKQDLVARSSLALAIDGVGPRERAPEAAEAELGGRAERRFKVRWGEPGLCGPGDTRPISQRAALLATFVTLEGGGTAVRHDPRVHPDVLRQVRAALDAAQSSHSPIRRIPGGEVDRVPPVAVYVYRNVQQMLDVSCVNRAAIGYYDGAIHLSGDVQHGLGTLTQTVVHEYVHHVLTSIGITVPTWLQEGLAMDLAGETWWVDPSLGLVAWLREKHLPFAAMTGAFAHAADEPFALAAYYQSYTMLELVRDRRGDEGIVALVRALAQGQVDAEEAFAWATGASGDSLEQAWREFVARRIRERDEPMQQLHEAAARARGE